jgi:hypothetical protein
MTDRIHAFTVVLDKDIREDDVQPILDAIKCIKCVASVTPIVANFEDHMARERVRQEWAMKFLEFYKELAGIKEKSP